MSDLTVISQRLPSLSNTLSPTFNSPIVDHPLDVNIGVSRGSPLWSTKIISLPCFIIKSICPASLKIPSSLSL